jgi:O-antigen/teichoic acid export membrane protein
VKRFFDTSFYVAGNLMTTSIGTLVMLAARFLVHPAAFGAATVAYTIQSYLNAGNTLFRSAIDRELAPMLVTDDAAAPKALLSGSYSLLLVALLIESGGFLIAAILVDQLLMKAAFLAVSAATLFDSLVAADKITLKATGRFQVLANLQVIAAVAFAAIVLVMAFLWGAIGFFAGLAVASAVGFILFQRVVDWPRFSVRLSGAPIKLIFISGGGIAVAAFVRQVLVTIDRFLAARYFSLRDLGVYSLGSSMMLTLHLLPMSIAGAQFPTFLQTVAREETEEARRSSERLQITLIVLCATLANLVIALAEPCVTVLLPAYHGGVRAYEMLAIGGYLYGSQVVSVQVLLAFRRTWTLVLIAGACLVIVVVIVSVSLNGQLESLAIASALGIGVSSALHNAVAGKLLGTQKLLILVTPGLALGLGTLFLARHGNVALRIAIALATTLAMVVTITRLHHIKWSRLRIDLRQYWRGDSM